ncbi:hypothetical protein V5F49_20180 [Xanthobacter sp. V3C-3]|uniref:hypothetical protein n=1 Tax=Xanthobacter lutulentifluminis TaxID=3119935 RepID=UPI00372BD56B
MSDVAQTAEAPADVLIHVRFNPNAEVFTIDRQPEGVSAKAWFERLYTAASPYYRTLANGRGFFRIPAPVFAGL